MKKNDNFHSENIALRTPFYKQGNNALIIGRTGSGKTTLQVDFLNESIVAVDKGKFDSKEHLSKN